MALASAAGNPRVAGQTSARASRRRLSGTLSARTWRFFGTGSRFFTLHASIASGGFLSASASANASASAKSCKICLISMKMKSPYQIISPHLSVDQDDCTSDSRRFTHSNNIQESDKPREPLHPRNLGVPTPPSLLPPIHVFSRLHLVIHSKTHQSTFAIATSISTLIYPTILERSPTDNPGRAHLETLDTTIATT